MSGAVCLCVREASHRPYQGPSAQELSTRSFVVVIVVQMLGIYVTFKNSAPRRSTMRDSYLPDFGPFHFYDPNLRNQGS